ncbi:MAG: S8 family serine peptidase [FCB group bacterium]|nr:S8 family serine peptidase [FCB group bacterium]
MLKHTSLLFLFLTSTIFATEIIPGEFLFCLKPAVQPLEISRTADGVLVDNAELNTFFAENGIVNIESWIPFATDADRDGDIYLNRVYRAYLADGFRNALSDIKEGITQLSSVYSAEYDYYRKATHQPNDPGYLQQCSLSAVKATQAWDLWDIAGGVFPGDREVLLASVDTAVDYTHPDLQSSIWINQDEVPGAIFDEVDTDNDGYVDADEVVAFLVESNIDANLDGEINLEDAVASSSPFINGIDDDNWDNNSNSFIDDLIGWDLSGWSGTDDNNPMPKAGVPNNSTWAHGTHVAGILSASTDNDLGMASTMYNGSILSVKCSRESQTGEPYVNDGFSGITYAAKLGHDKGTHVIINCSWGGGGYNSYEQTVINNAFNNYDAVIVAAAGNGNDLGGEEHASHYPSSYSNVISVAAIGCSGSWGHWATYHETVDLSAPGEGIYSTIIDGGYESWNGSSMASPNAASCIGLLYSFYPDWSNQQLVDRIIESADPFIYEVNPDEYLQGQLGTGMVDAFTAIGALVYPGLYYYNHSVTISNGDGDDNLNPGESAELRVTLGNLDGWQNANNVAVILTSTNPGVTITDSTADYGTINEGGIGINIGDTFAFELSNSIELGEVEFILEATAESVPGYDYQAAIPFTIEVTLNQQGWPIDSLYEDLNNVETAPLVMDVMGDSQKEIIFGDYSGYLYCVNSAGELVEDGLFPFDTGNQIWGSPAAADIDNDGNIEIVTTSKSKHLYILDPADGSMQVDYNAGQYLMGSPAIGNLDDDEDLEIVVGGYKTTGKLFVINPDGSDAAGFPYDLGEKVLRGVALADFNNNGKSDIVCATESHHVWLIYDDGTVAPGFPFTAENKFKSAPSIMEMDGQKVIFAGSNDDKLYAINGDGSLRFEIDTGDDIITSPGFMTSGTDNYIFWGSNDGFVYGIDTAGNILPGWPVDTGISVKSSPVFSDLDGDGFPEIIIGTGSGQLLGLTLSGTPVTFFPITALPALNGTPTIADTDGDGDLEVLVGSVSSLVDIDYKAQGTTADYWYTHRGNSKRTGYYGDLEGGGCGDCMTGDVNCDGLIDILDVVRTVFIVMNGTDEVTECEALLADITQDGIVDILDIVTMVNTIIDGA